MAVGDSVLDRLVSVLNEYHAGGTADVSQVASRAIIRSVDSEASLVPADRTNVLGRTSEIKREAWSEGLVYYRLAGLDGTAGSDLATRLRGDGSNCMAGAVLDIRDAGGDSAEAVVDIASCFVAPETVLFHLRHQRTGMVAGYAVAAGTKQVTMPVMFLVNTATSHASEILARVLKGRKGVMLVGSPTAGRAGVRELVPVTSNLYAHIVTRLAEAPSPDVVWTGAVMPDVVSPRGFADSIAVTEVPTKEDPEKPISERAKADRELMRRVWGDPPLARAVDILLGLRILTYASGSTNGAAGGDAF